MYELIVGPYFLPYTSYLSLKLKKNQFQKPLQAPQYDRLDPANKSSLNYNMISILRNLNSSIFNASVMVNKKALSQIKLY